jgi:hypothetical protein
MATPWAGPQQVLASTIRSPGPVADVAHRTGALCGEALAFQIGAVGVRGAGVGAIGAWTGLHHAEAPFRRIRRGRARMRGAIVAEFEISGAGGRGMDALAPGSNGPARAALGDAADGITGGAARGSRGIWANIAGLRARRGPASRAGHEGGRRGWKDRRRGRCTGRDGRAHGRFWRGARTGGENDGEEDDPMTMHAGVRAFSPSDTQAGRSRYGGTAPT